MSTKKTVDTEIVEDVEKIEPEVIEEVKEPVVDDVKEIVPEVKAPLRGISTPSMIHTHLDNFLAKLCGETPVDDKVRNSLEFWINELAEGNGGSTKKIYCHPIVAVRQGTYDRIGMFIFNNDSTPFTATSFIAWKNALYDLVGSECRILLTGSITFPDNKLYPLTTLVKDSTHDVMFYTSGVGAYMDMTDETFITQFGQYFFDGVNAIN